MGGGKGKKRREKNYKEAHGIGKNRLPPPPLRSSLDAIPSKLRKIISFNNNYNNNTNSSSPSEPSNLSSFSVDDAQQNKKKKKNKTTFSQNLSTKEKSDFVSFETKLKETLEKDDSFSTEKKKKKKWKRQQAEDLRFVAELGAVGSKRKERKKKLLEERKKKHKKAKTEEDLNFPGREEIKFGEVVQAPPKLVTVPKRFGSSVNASQERIRLRTIEAYRNHKKWASRPGLGLPTTDLTYNNSSVLPLQKQP